METLATLFFAAVASILPLVSTTSGGAPVTIKACDVAYIESTGIVTVNMQYTNGVTLTALNSSSKEISSFTVAGSYNGYKVTDTWAGTLLPNATVTIWKHYQQLPYSGPKADCHVSKVTYKDGTAWAAPASAMMSK
jgi:hypothetical protein